VRACGCVEYGSLGSEEAFRSNYPLLELYIDLNNVLNSNETPEA
jgi:hypothetical protein